MIRSTLKRLLTEDTTPKGFPIPDHVKAVRVVKNGYTFAIWENPKVSVDSDGKWQGSWLLVDGGWSSITPTDSYGYVSKQELMKELLRCVKERANRKGPSSPHNVVFNR